MYSIYFIIFNFYEKGHYNAKTVSYESYYDKK